MSICDLPDDIIEVIAKYLCLRDAAHLARALVNQELSRLIGARKTDVDSAVSFVTTHQERYILICDDGEHTTYEMYISPYISTRGMKAPDVPGYSSFPKPRRWTGKLRGMFPTNTSVMIVTNLCPECKGTGKSGYRIDCTRCRGKRLALSNSVRRSKHKPPPHTGIMFRAWTPMCETTSVYQVQERMGEFYTFPDLFYTG